MKKFTLFFVALFTATIAFASVEIDGIYYNLNDETKTAEVTSGNNKYSGDIIIPEKVTYNATEYLVTSIDDYAFYNCVKLTSIKISKSVTLIGWEVFVNCTSLNEITLESTTPPILKTHDGTAAGTSSYLGFYGIIYIPDNTLVAYQNAWNTNDLGTEDKWEGEEYTFINNENSLSVDVKTPGTLSDLIVDAGLRLINVAKITISGTLNDDDFKLIRETMTSLAELNLSHITNNDFKLNDNKNIIKVTLPSSITYIGDTDCYWHEIGTFQGCTSLKNIEIPNSVTKIGCNAFLGCSSLTSISIPNTVTTIGEGAFNSCKSLFTISIPDGVITIGKNAFCSCESLKDVYLGKSVKTLGEGSFASCLSLESITIPENVQYIESAAFASCSTLVNINIKFGVNSIGDRAFASCASLKTIKIPNSVETISNSAFYQCINLKSITIGNRVKSIGNNAFTGHYQYDGNLDTIICLGLTPPDAENLKVNTKYCKLIVPKESYKDYLKHTYWGQFFNIDTLDSNLYKKININSNNSSFGSTSNINGYFNINDTITITATPNTGYHFTQWSDGNTDNPRKIIVTENVELTAEFAINQYDVNVTADGSGTVIGSGTYDYGTEVAIEAIANEGYHFVKWSDGNTENPRTIVVVENIELRAEFELYETPVDNVDESSVIIYVQDGVIYVEGATENYHILDAAGRLIYSGNASTLQLPQGIYLITMGGEVEKIVL